MCKPLLDLNTALGVVKGEVRDTVFSRVSAMCAGLGYDAEKVLATTWKGVVAAYVAEREAQGRQVKHMPGPESKSAWDRLCVLLREQQYAARAAEARELEEAAKVAKVAEEAHQNELVARQLDRIREADPFGFPADSVQLSVRALTVVIDAVEGLDGIDSNKFLRAVVALQEVMEMEKRHE